MSTVLLSLVTFMILLGYFLMNHQTYKGSHPYECGFEPFIIEWLPFSSRFFTISVTFIIFDVEVALIFPTLILADKDLYAWTFMSSMMIMILTMGTLFEWKNGLLSWI